MNLVSVIIPVYNASRYFKKCLDSIVQQSYQNFEVVIVDDASTDNSIEIAESYAKNDKRFRIYRNEKNLGCGLTRRRAIELGIGDWFAFIDADDYFEPTFIEDMLTACLRTKSEIAICGTFERDQDYNYLRQSLAECEYTVSGRDLYYQYMTSSWIMQYNGNKFYAKRVIEAVQYSDLRFCEDSMTTYKWLWEANQAVVIPRSYYHYVRHLDSNSNHSNDELTKSTDEAVCINDHWDFCVKHGFTDLLPRLQAFVNDFIFKGLSLAEYDSEEYKILAYVKRKIVDKRFDR